VDAVVDTGAGFTACEESLTSTDTGFESFRTFAAPGSRGALFTFFSSEGNLAIAFDLTSDAMSPILISKLINFNAVVS
jgi:hypothetical protein